MVLGAFWAAESGMAFLATFGGNLGAGEGVIGRRAAGRKCEGGGWVMKVFSTMRKIAVGASGRRDGYSGWWLRNDVAGSGSDKG